MQQKVQINNGKKKGPEETLSSSKQEETKLLTDIRQYGFHNKNKVQRKKKTPPPTETQESTLGRLSI